MAFKIFFTELRRSFQVSISLILFCFILGLVFVSSIYLTKYLTQLFQDVNLGVDMVLLPKGITPDSLQKSLIAGRPEALMPVALFETLSSQAEDEVRRKNLLKPSIDLMAIQPYQNEAGRTEIAKIGDIKIIKNIDTTIWKDFSFKDLTAVQDKFQPKEIYSTPEWTNKTIFAILVNGDPETLANLKKMIDRRTIAQAYFLIPGESMSAKKLQKLESGLLYLTLIILFIAALGILNSFQKLHAQRKIVFQSLDELRISHRIKGQIYGLQIGFLILLPLFFGTLASSFILPLMISLF